MSNNVFNATFTISGNCSSLVATTVSTGSSLLVTNQTMIVNGTVSNSNTNLTDPTTFYSFGVVQNASSSTLSF